MVDGDEFCVVWKCGFDLDVGNYFGYVVYYVIVGEECGVVVY